MQGNPTHWLPRHGHPFSVAEKLVQQTIRALANPVVFVALLAILTILAFSLNPA